MSEETTDRDELLRLTRDHAALGGFFAGFAYGVFATALIGGIVLMLVWSK